MPNPTSQRKISGHVDGENGQPLDPVQEGTQMTFHLRGVDGTKGDGFFYDGWNEVLVSLGEYLGQSLIAR